MICAIVLAAGRSRRMGRQKLLLPVGGKPVIARIVDQLRQSPVDQIIVVSGGDREKVEAALLGCQVSFVNNPDAAGDMLSSIRCGLRALPGSCAGVLIVLGDQPRLDSNLVTRMVAEFQVRGRGIVLPVHQGHRAHPVLIAMRYRDELLTDFEGVGLHGLLHAHPGEVLAVEIADGSILEDMDTPEDYQRQLAMDGQ